MTDDKLKEIFESAMHPAQADKLVEAGWDLYNHTYEYMVLELITFD